MARLLAVLCGVCGVLAAVLAAPVSDCPRDTEPDHPVFLASDQSCSQFYLCSNGRPVLLTCPDGLYFNPDTDQCDYSYNVNCTEPVPPTTTESPASTPVWPNSTSTESPVSTPEPTTAESTTTESTTTELSTTEPSTTESTTMETTTIEPPISTTKSSSPTTKFTTTRSPVSTIQQ